MSGVALWTGWSNGRFAASSWAFPALVAGLLLALLAGQRILMNAGIGGAPATVGPGVASGYICNLVDNLSYASWAQQARDGALTFRDLYTLEPHDPLYFNAFFLITGFVAALGDVSVTPVLVLAGWIGAATVVLVTFAAARMLFGVHSAHWATLLVAFSSGLSAPLFLLFTALDSHAPVGADVSYLDAFTFSAFFAYPYHSVAYGLLAACMLALFRADTPVPSRSAVGWRALLLPLAFLTASTHPYESALLLGSYGVFWLLTFASRGSRGHARRRLVLLGLLAGGIAPVLVYNAWLARQPVWENFASFSLSLGKTRTYWLIGYGLVLLTTLLGAYRCLMEERLERARWLAIWVLGVVLLLVVFNVRQTKICNGAYIPICILAGLGCCQVGQWINRLGRASVRLSLSLLAALAVAGMFSSGLHAAILRTWNYVHDWELESILTHLRLTPPGETRAVLCDAPTGVLLPGLTGARVYVGHGSLSPNYYDGLARLAAAGVVLPRYIPPSAPPPSEGAFHNLLRGTDCCFVLLRREMAAMAYADRSSLLVPVTTRGYWCLYERAP